MKRSKRSLKAQKTSKKTTKIAKTKTTSSTWRRSSTAKAQPKDSPTECKQANEDSDAESVKTDPQTKLAEAVDITNVKKQQPPDLPEESSMASDDIRHYYRNYSPGETSEKSFVSYLSTPCAQDIDLKTLVYGVYGQLYRHHQLTWHSRLIPSHTIWLKIGGDNGGGTFKMAFEIANLPGPLQ